MKYIFRGRTILAYDPETKHVRTPLDEDGFVVFNQCKFIPEDYQLLAQFFNIAEQHAKGNHDVNLEDFNVA